MEPNQKRSNTDFLLTRKQWVYILAPFVVALVVALLMYFNDTDRAAVFNTPNPVHASLGASDRGRDHESMEMITTPQEMHDHGALYACPMMCVPPSDQPGNCPVCGMALAPVARPDDVSSSVAPRLHLTAQAVHLAEIQTLPVTRQAVTNEVRLFGRIDFDSAHITKITAFMPGVIDRVHVKRAGQFVRWGDPLFDIYSSDLLETQRQLVEAMQYVPGFLAFQASTPHVAQDVPIQVRQKRVAGGDSTPAQKEALQKIKALRHKLSILGLPKRDIDQFMKKGEATGIATVYAPMYGQITVQNATEGTFVNTGTALFTVADPKYVWARLDAYESDYPWIRIGQRVTFTTEAYPGEVFEAKVVYIDPVFNPVTRTFSIGAITTQDQGGRLKAGMLSRAVVHAKLDASGNIAGTSASGYGPPLVIPASAPLITGKRAVVYVAVPGDTPVFEGREVELGPRTKDHYVVRNGLAEGEQVVVNGNFKIDSAMQISAKPSLMSSSGGIGGSGHDHLGGRDGQAQTFAGTPTIATDGSEHAADQEIDREHSLADNHQHPDLSNPMHDHYMGLRRKSRMAPPSGISGSLSEGTRASADNQARHGADGQHGLRQNHTAQRSDHQHQIRRRKPGQYGDSTRQGASLLEEHRQRWRPQTGQVHR